MFGMRTQIHILLEEGRQWPSHFSVICNILVQVIGKAKQLTQVLLRPWHRPIDYGLDASDIPLTAVNTPSSMLWEWLAMPQVLSNAPATFNCLVTQLFRSHRGYAQDCFDDIFVHSRAEHGR